MSQGVMTDHVPQPHVVQPHGHGASPDVIQLSSSKFMLGCLAVALAVLLAGPRVAIPNWIMAAEVFATILALFVFGSIKYQIHKNALTYGAGLVVLATFFAKMGTPQAAASLVSEFPEAHDLSHVFTLHWIQGTFVGFEKLIHVDTMLFILGLTFFVSVIAQTRLLESASFLLLRLNRGAVLGTVLAIAAMVPFIGLLIVHATNHHVPLFFASFAGFLVALAGLWTVPKARRLALHEARHEFSEYYFLFPLFLSISLLTKIAFFDQLAELMHAGIEHLGVAAMAPAQFFGATFLSALLDNNVVADFAGRAIRELPEIGVIYLFAMAQIAGYAAGGCWTHIGSAQSVVAFAFIKRDVDERFTPFTWIKTMTPILLSIVVALTVLILVEAVVFHG